MAHGPYLACLLVLVNFFFWNIALLIGAQIVHSCYCATAADLRSCDRDLMPQSLFYLSSGPLQEKLAKFSFINESRCMLVEQLSDRVLDSGFGDECATGLDFTIMSRF